MAQRFPRFADGDPVAPWIFNLIFDELDRWREMTGSGAIGVDNAAGGGPPTIVDYRDDGGLIPGQLTSSLATGTIASPASATVTLLVASGSGVLTATGGVTGQTVYNTLPLNSTLASGTNVWMTSFSGAYYLVQAGC